MVSVTFHGHPAMPSFGLWVVDSSGTGEATSMATAEIPSRSEVRRTWVPPAPGRILAGGICLALGLGSLPAGGDAQTPPEPDPIPAGQAAPPGSYGELDVIHYEVVIGLPGPGGTVIQGDATLTLRPTRSGVERAVLDFTGLAVVEVEVDGAVVATSFELGRLAVPLPPGTGPADTLTLRVRYQGTPDDGLILRENVHGRPAAFVDNWPNRTRFWLPSVDHPSDKATASFTVLAPASWRVVANGVQVGEPEPAPPAPDGSPRRRWQWRTAVDLSPYNLVFGAAEMEVKPLGLAACGAAPASPRPDGCVEVTAWLFREDTAQASLSFLRAAEMVDVFTELVGPFPFEKLAHVQSATRFGGMENASAIFYSERGLASGRNMEGTVAHETAHQWFGDHATQAEWAELWLSEGFATYFGHLFFEKTQGRDSLRRLMDGDRQEVLGSRDVERPVIDRDETDLFALLNDNTYPKAGWVLHMLRGILGDETFFRGVRRYYREYGGRNTTTRDFRAVMEGESGEELGWFFHQWLEEPGFPRLSVQHAWAADRGEVVVALRQEPRKGWPIFRLPMEVELVGPDGTAVRHRVELTEAEQSFRFSSAAPPERVTLDPGGWVLWEDVTGR